MMSLATQDKDSESTKTMKRQRQRYWLSMCALWDPLAQVATATATCGKFSTFTSYLKVNILYRPAFKLSRTKTLVLLVLNSMCTICTDQLAMHCFLGFKRYIRKSLGNTENFPISASLNTQKALKGQACKTNFKDLLGLFVLVILVKHLIMCWQWQLTSLIHTLRSCNCTQCKY